MSNYNANPPIGLRGWKPNSQINAKFITITESSAENCKKSDVESSEIPPNSGGTVTLSPNNDVVTENGNKNSLKFLQKILYYIGDNGEKEKQDEDEDLLVPIIGAASGFCLIVLITVIFVYYCKVRKNKETEVKQENPVYDAWTYDNDDDNYVKDVNINY